MDYYSFRRYIGVELRSYLPEQYRKYTCRLVTVSENQCMIDMIELVPSDDCAKGPKAAICVEQVYEEFLKTFRLKETMKTAVAWLIEDSRLRL